MSTSKFAAAVVLVFATSLQSADSPAAREAYVMLSGWGLYPAISKEDPAKLRQAFGAISRNHVSGIVYGTLGVPPKIREKAKLSSDFDPNVYNRTLFALARESGAKLWLQLRYYDNEVALPGAPPRNLTAPEILSDRNAEKAFVDAAMAAVRTYVDAHTGPCTVVLGEEETMYHSKEGGGFFWAGQKLWDASTKARDDQFLKPAAALDQVFVDNFVGINALLMKRIKAGYPACRVGPHIGHAPLYQSLQGKPVYAVILQRLQPLKPDFTFYDLYNKVSKTEAEFRTKLADRVKMIRGFGQPVYFLAQLHTTNNFGSGGGRTLSAAQLDATVNLARQLGVAGFGYYAKNAVVTICSKTNAASAAGCDPVEDASPLDPNTSAQNMVWESSPQRWEYGIEELKAFLAETP